MQNLISVKNLTFDYVGTRALDNVSFNINKGSIVALVGPNGAGKSTLLRCIAALDYPLSGQVLLNGSDVLDNPRESHRDIGYLSDNFGLYDKLTVAQCLTYAALAQGVATEIVPTKVAETAQKLGIVDKLNQPAGALSRGQRQRVAIGQAIIHAPAVLLLDEPASGLDPEARYSLSQVFLTLRDSGMTLIVSSHILAELEDYSTEMLVLKNGKILQQQVVTSFTSHLVAMELTLVHIADAEKLSQLLSAVSGVNQFEIAADIATIAMDEAVITRHALLKMVINADIAINRYIEAQNSLQHSYLLAVNAKLPIQELVQPIIPRVAQISPSESV